MTFFYSFFPDIVDMSKKAEQRCKLKELAVSMTDQQKQQSTQHHFAGCSLWMPTFNLLL